MIDLYNGELLDMLPSSMSTEIEQQCISYALKRGVQLIVERANMTRTQSVIDELPEPILDVLATELHTPYYLENADINMKRSLIKRTILWNLRAGTPSAVAELIETVFGEGNVVEWFDYDEPPYTPGTFDIITNARMTEDIVEQFFTIIERVKNVRSHIRRILIHRTVNNEVYAGIGQLQQYRPAAVIDGYQVSKSTSQMIYTGVATRQTGRPAAILDAENG